MYKIYKRKLILCITLQIKKRNNWSKVHLRDCNLSLRKCFGINKASTLHVQLVYETLFSAWENVKVDIG